MTSRRSTALGVGLGVLLLAALGVVIAQKVVGCGVRGDPRPATSRVTVNGGVPPAPVAPAGSGSGAAPAAPLAPHGRAGVVDVPSGGAASVDGRVIDASTGAGVDAAELAFAAIDGSGAVTVRTAAGGGFALTSDTAAPGRYQLATVTAPGYLPYAPEWAHSRVEVELVAARRVGGVRVYLFPAVEYTGTVVDASNAPVAGARVRLIGNPAGEQVLERLTTEWTTDGNGTFRFSAPDDSIFEAEGRGARGRARLDGDVAITHQLVIRVTGAPAADLVIEGRVIEKGGGPLADVQVTALPTVSGGSMATAKLDASMRVPAFTTTGPDGGFVLRGLDADLYAITAELEGHATTGPPSVPGGTKGLVIELDAGEVIAGTVRTADDAVVPAFTVLVWRRDGITRDLVEVRSLVDAAGRFAVHVAPGAYELVAAAPGWADSAPMPAAAGAKDVELVVRAGAVLAGRVVSAKDGSPVAYARVMIEARGGGASVQPANAGTVTGVDGQFDLAGLPPGPVSITVAAAGFHPKIEAGFTAADGATIGPVTITLTPLDGAAPQLELVGIGVALAADGDLLTVSGLVPGGAAAEAGIVVGDVVSAIDGAPVIDLGLDGAIARIRGIEGTIVRVTLARQPPVELAIPRRKLRS